MRRVHDLQHTQCTAAQLEHWVHANRRMHALCQPLYATLRLGLAPTSIGLRFEGESTWIRVRVEVRDRIGIGPRFEGERS